MILSNFLSYLSWKLSCCFCFSQRSSSLRKHSFTLTHTHTQTRTKTRCPFSCVVVSYISRYLEVNLPQGKTIKASQRWAISPCLVDHFPSNIHGASSSKADQCCENRNLSCSSWRQRRKRSSPEDGSRISDVPDAIYYVLITTKLAIGGVALSWPCGLCGRPAWWRPSFVSCRGPVTHRAIKVQGDVGSYPHVVNTVLPRAWWNPSSQKGGERCPNGTRSSRSAAHTSHSTDIKASKPLGGDGLRQSGELAVTHVETAALCFQYLLCLIARLN